MEEELVEAIYTLIESVNNLAVPTELDQKSFTVSSASLSLSIIAIFYSMYTSYDVHRTENRVNLYDKRKELAKRTDLQLIIWEKRLTISQYHVKMPNFEYKDLKYLFDESVFELFCTILADYEKLLKMNNSDSQCFAYTCIIDDIYDNREELTEKIDYYLELFRVPEKLTAIKFLKYFFLGDKEKKKGKN